MQCCLNISIACSRVAWRGVGSDWRSGLHTYWYFRDSNRFQKFAEIFFSSSETISLRSEYQC